MPSKAVKPSLEKYARKRQAEIDAVVAEFSANIDALAALIRMAVALLAYRHWLRQIVDAGEMIAQGKPFVVMGPGPHWKPDPAEQYPWRRF